MRWGILLFAMVALFVSAADSCAQNSPSAPERKIVSRVAPVYPDLAKKMHIRGVVRVEAIVRANGIVKSTRVLGGNPVLVDSALDAVGKWRFETTQGETTEVVQLMFDGR